MKHLGNIVEINGAEIEPVDCIIGGSPCQDLSVAGKRAGLDGERSGLFMEQVRIVKEMREHDKSCGRTDVTARPRWMVWENVPGALSSGTPKGEDFRIVLEEIARIADPTAVIPRPQKWSKSGCVMGDGWSIAWRIHDAQFWGVPQRRNRISLVADFAGGGAAEVLFERKSMFRDSEESGETRERTSESSEGCADASSFTLKIRGGREVDSLGKRAGKGALVQTELSATLGVSQDQTLITRSCLNGWDVQSKRIFSETSVSQTLNSGTFEGKNIVPSVLQNPDKCLNGWDVQSKHIQPESGVAESLYAGECRGGGGESYVMQTKVYGISPYESNAMKSDNPHSGIYEADTSRTLDANGGSPACNQGGMVVLEGNGSRPSHLGDGYSEGETMYTLNSAERHAVAFRKQGHPQNAEQPQLWEHTETNDTLSSFDNSEMRTPTVILENHPADSRVKVKEDGVFQTLSSRMGTGGNIVPMLMEPVCIGNGQSHIANHLTEGVSQTLNCMHDQMAVMLNPGSVVRRLTPTECERLQGFPDGWTDIGEWEENGKEHKESSDSSRYKALGNSIALPYWRWLIKRISATYPRNPTLGSLFDGIGGFCLCWERTNGVGTARWASEIEPFCIAVTKKHFGDGDKEGDIRKYL